MVTQTQSPAKAASQSRRAEQQSIVGYLAGPASAVNAGANRIIRSVGGSADMTAGMESSDHSTPVMEKRKRSTGAAALSQSMVTQTSMLNQMEEDEGAAGDGNSSDDAEQPSAKARREEQKRVEGTLASLDGIRSLDDQEQEISAADAAIRDGLGRAGGELSSAEERNRIGAACGAISKVFGKKREMAVALPSPGTPGWDPAGDLEADLVGEEEIRMDVFNPQNDLVDEMLPQDVTEVVNKKVEESMTSAIDKLTGVGKQQLDSLMQMQKQLFDTSNEMFAKQFAELEIKQNSVEGIAKQMMDLKVRMFQDHAARSAELDQFAEGVKKDLRQAAAQQSLGEEAVRAIAGQAVEAAKEATQQDVATLKIAMDSFKVRMQETENTNTEIMLTNENLKRDQLALRELFKEDQQGQRQLVGSLHATFLDKLNEVNGAVEASERAHEREKQEMAENYRYINDKVEAFITLVTRRIEDLSRKVDEGAERALTGGPLPAGVTPEVLSSVCRKHNLEEDKYWLRSASVHVQGQVVGGKSFEDCRRFLSRVYLGFLMEKCLNWYVSNTGGSVRVTFTSEHEAKTMLLRAKKICMERRLRSVNIEILFPPRFLQMKRDLLQVGAQMKLRGEIKRYDPVMKQGRVQLRTITNDDVVDYITINPTPEADNVDDEGMEVGEVDPVAQPAPAAEEETCVVCLEPLTASTHGGLMQMNQCHHRVHRLCQMVSFITNGPACMICRQTEEGLAAKVTCTKCTATGLDNFDVGELRLAPCGHIHKRDCVDDWFSNIGENHRIFDEESLNRILSQVRVQCFQCTRVEVPRQWLNIAATVVQQPRVSVQRGGMTRGRGAARPQRGAAAGVRGQIRTATPLNQGQARGRGGGQTRGSGRGAAAAGVQLTGGNRVEIEEHL